ncbi:MAG TPA: tyrosine/phenylalanine carboxypeptidase domain-containing protein [Actinomycetota bacterium]|nr:tyrosine/phenylalanine carboxypeptidase domain-containing protein [Actinomycetota bacterium]
MPDLSRLANELPKGEPVRVDLLGGHLDIERPLPVLVVHRERADASATSRLLLGHSALMVVPRDAPSGDVREVVRTVVRAQADEFGAFLLLELWDSSVPYDAIHGRSIPFRLLCAETADGVPQPAEVLRDALEAARIGRAVPTVDIDTSVPIAPPGSDPLLEGEELRELGCVLLGLEVPAVYRAGDEGPIFPQVLRTLRHYVTSALQKTFFEFIRLDTNQDLKDYRELGRRHLVPGGSEIDQKLAAVGSGLDALFHITPMNTERALRDFIDGGFEENPSFHYRPLPFDPDLVKRELYDLPIEDVPDPALASVLREKRLELDRTITLLEDRDTPRFLAGSLQLYPGVDDGLLDEADAILSKVSPVPVSGERVLPASFAERARREIDHYRALVPDISSEVHLRDDMPGIMVSRGQLHLSSRARIGQGRVEALIQHEVGTHIVTYLNGLGQPLLLLSAGLPGYEQTQEGLAMFAEYVCGGLEANRLRTVAARIVAVEMVIKGADFVEIFRRVHREIELPVEAAWSVTMRVTRGGGSTKDAIYLRGLIDVLGHVASGHPMEPLLIGKIAIEHVPLIEELLWRQVLKPPRLRPRWLDVDGAEERLARVREGVRPTDLVES